MGTGYILMPVGLGFQTNRSAGQLIITVAGRGFATSGGFGFRARSGRQPGFRGAKDPITVVGRHCHQRPASIAGPVSATGPIVITTSGRTNMSSSPPGSWEKSGSNAQSCPSSATSPSLVRPRTSQTSLTTTPLSPTRGRVMRSCEL